MEERKKKLLINLVSSFLTLFSICLFIALLIILKFHQDCALVIVGMITVCATLYAPVAAFFLYDSWKEQKKYELMKEVILKILTELTDSYSQISKKASYMYDFYIPTDSEHIGYDLINITEDAVLIDDKTRESFLDFKTNDLDSINLYIGLYLKVNNESKINEELVLYRAFYISLHEITKRFFVTYEKYIDKYKELKDIKIIEYSSVVSLSYGYQSELRPYVEEIQEVLRSQQHLTMGPFHTHCLGFLQINKNLKEQYNICFNALSKDLILQ